MKNNNSYSKILTGNFLYRAYWIDNKSIPQIAKEVGCSKPTIFKYLRKRKLRLKVSTILSQGKNNPNFKHGETLKKHRCIDCDKKISKDSGLYGCGRCSSCATKEQHNIGVLNSKGENNPNYKDGKSREPYPMSFNNTLKEQIRQRDNHQCQICGIKQEDYYRKLDVHHIDYDKDNLNPENLITLCQNCHMEANGNREIYIEFFRILKEIN